MTNEVGAPYIFLFGTIKGNEELPTETIAINCRAFHLWYNHIYMCKYIKFQNDNNIGMSLWRVKQVIIYTNVHYAFIHKYANKVGDRREWAQRVPLWRGHIRIYMCSPSICHVCVPVCVCYLPFPPFFLLKFVYYPFASCIFFYYFMISICLWTESTEYWSKSRA